MISDRKVRLHVRIAEPHIVDAERKKEKPFILAGQDHIGMQRSK